MSDDRLASGIEVSALLAKASREGGFGTVLHKGDHERGTILIVIAERGDPRALVERLLQPSGRYAWQRREMSESGAMDQYLARARRNDPDLWVIELDVPDSERFIAEMISDC